MSNDKKMVRGRAPLTIVRNASGIGVHIYFSQIVEPAALDPTDRDRLLADGFLEWVVPEGGGWKLVEDSESGDAGTPVMASQPTMADPKPDPGLVNTAIGSSAEQAKADDVEAKRAAARAKLPEDGSPPTLRHGEDVWVEYAVKQGYDRDAAEKAGKDELAKLFGKK